MQVFKLYGKVLKKYIGFVLMFVGIFMGMLCGFIIPAQVQDTPQQFENAKCEFAVFDYDNSEESRGLIKYLESAHKRVEIADTKLETLQDELYNRNVDCVVMIEDGFETAVAEGKSQDCLIIYDIPGVTIGMLFKQDLSGFMNVLDTYMVAGYPVEEALDLALEKQKLEVKVTLPDGSDAVAHGGEYYFYSYIAWVLIAMCITGITPVLLAINKKLLRDRVYCSSYQFSKMNVELLFGVLLTGFVICVAFNLLSIIMFGKTILSIKGALSALNTMVYMLVALALTFTVSQCTDNPQVVSIMANVISLGMAFLCGIFVPMEFLSDTVIKIAHFLPAYWYEKTVLLIESYQNTHLSQIFLFMGIEILFAIAIVVVGMAISRKKQVA